MLMNIGPVVFDLVVNAHEYELEGEADFARKDVVGARRSHEWVGDGDDRLTVRGRLFPEKLGGAGAVSALMSMKSSGAPQMVCRGDGMVIGWFVVRRVRATNQYLNGAGQPRLIEIEVSAERCGAPSAASAFGALLNLLG